MFMISSVSLYYPSRDDYDSEAESEMEMEFTASLLGLRDLI